ncbi:hypothetical protein C0W42_22150 [Photobacterium kishitanii]|uniref:AAA family ATPase n=1 Tax=Photobacterium kishitanii TaxID=318456 RepID=UPI000D16FA65|nr:AAA family ATPase [Photobacterium kishitanii]PSU84334.1 hypothetical protein C0W42_22150 [Photobacterium kishitanii]
MTLNIKVTDVQHVSSVEFDIPLTVNKLTCIVGKNGVGKTTLIKAIRNFSRTDTFVKTSQDSIFKGNSSIIYSYDSKVFSFLYDEEMKTISCKDQLPEDINNIINVELPMPYGNRFSYFQSISSSDKEIRSKIVLDDYSSPEELILLLNTIYQSNKFDSLAEIEIEGNLFYCLLIEERYIREDYLSSGEFFLISLYRKIKSRSKLIVIDEIDISLDASAQVFLVNYLREFCSKYNVSILFTTHSLALMRTLNVDELYYMSSLENGIIKIENQSFNYVKSLLFGFNGWDKYILTEDKTLQNFITYIIKNKCPRIFYECKIIYIGGGHNVVDLMKRNQTEEFLSKSENVISILDGDLRDMKYTRIPSVYFIPFQSVEKELYKEYNLEGSTLERVSEERFEADGKKIYKSLIKEGKMNENEIFQYLIDKNLAAIETFKDILTTFLTAR